MKKLFCFDFDKTLVKGHFHNEIGRLGEYIEVDEIHSRFEQSVAPITQEDTIVVNGIVQTGKGNPKYDKKLVKQEASKLLKNPDIGLRDKQELKKAFESILGQGHQIAITSFTKYPDAISTALEELGLTKVQLEGINIIGGFPKGGARDPNAKTEHIEKAMELSGIKNKHNIVLIDDSIKNINHAKKQGISTVHVKDGFKWDNVTKLIESQQINATSEVSNNISAPLDKLHNLSATDQTLINELKNKFESNVELRQKDSVKSPPKSHRNALAPAEYQKHDAPPLIPPKSDEVRKKYNFSPQDLKKGASSNVALHNKLQQELKQKISLKKNQSSFGR